MGAPFLLAPHLIQLPHQRTSPHLTSPHLTSPHLTFNGTHAKEEDIEYQDTRRNCEQTADNTNTTTTTRRRRRYGRTWQAREEGGGGAPGQMTAGGLKTFPSLGPTPS